MSDRAEQLYEQVLVLRCQTGDEAAFAELVGRYGPRLRYFVRKMLAPLADSEDVLQEIWLDVFRGVGRLAAPAAFRTWLYRVARDRTLRTLRRRRPEPKPLPDEPVDVEDDGGDFTAEDAAHVHAALDGLAPEHREVLVLRFLEEMNYDDIARVVGCQLGTVRSRLHYAKRALRRLLERNNPDE